jgi:hypothetical protein
MGDFMLREYITDGHAGETRADDHRQVVVFSFHVLFLEEPSKISQTRYLFCHICKKIVAAFLQPLLSGRDSEIAASGVVFGSA